MIRSPFPLIFCLLLLGAFQTAHAQQAAQPQAQRQPAAAAASDSVQLIEFGLHSVGYAEHIFLQFTGNQVYESAESPSYLSWIGYHYAYPVDLPFLGGMSFGGEYHFVTLEPTSQQSLSNQPRPTLNANLGIFSARAYFGNLRSSAGGTDNLFNLYLGLGWGLMSGSLSGEYVFFSPKTFQTSISGIYTHREIGMILKGDTWGMGISVRFTRAPFIKVADDLFNQKEPSDDNLNLVFDGVSNTFFFVVKF